MPGTQAVQTNHEYRNLPIATLVESPTNPRKRFDERTLGELAASFKTQGALVDWVRERRISLGDEYKVIDCIHACRANGERFRWSHVKISRGVATMLRNSRVAGIFAGGTSCYCGPEPAAYTRFSSFSHRTERSKTPA